MVYPLFPLVALVAPAVAAPPTGGAADAAYEAEDWKEAARLYGMLVKREARDAPRAWFRLGYARARGGDPAGAVPAYERALELGFYPPVTLWNLACAHALAGQPDAAFARLDAAVATGTVLPAQLQSDPDLAPLRADPRFAALVETADRAARPCRYIEMYRSLDYWLGTWIVTDTSGARVGSNRIVAIEEGCALQESWQSALGPTGTSVTRFEATRGVWIQDWVDSRGGSIHYEGSATAPGVVELAGTRLVPGKPPVPSRLRLERQDDGSVLQRIEAQGADGAWTVGFEGLYRPAPSE